MLLKLLRNKTFLKKEITRKSFCYNRFEIAFDLFITNERNANMTILYRLPASGFTLNDPYYDILASYIGKVGVIKYGLSQKDTKLDDDSISTLRFIFNDIESIFYWFDIIHLLEDRLPELLKNDDPLLEVNIISKSIHQLDYSKLFEYSSFNSIQSCCLLNASLNLNDVEDFKESKLDEIYKNIFYRGMPEYKTSIMYLYRNIIYFYPIIDYDMVIISLPNQPSRILNKKIYETLQNISKIEVCKYSFSENEEDINKIYTEFASAYNMGEFFTLFDYMKAVKPELLNDGIYSYIVTVFFKNSEWIDTYNIPLGEDVDYLSIITYNVLHYKKDYDENF